MNPARRILLIDDDPAIAEMLALLVAGFRRGPFVLDYVADYATGLQRLLSGSCALCLLDYHLGSRNGLELLREARAARCPTPIILLTGTGEDETDLAAMDGGAADYLEKRELTPHGLERAICYALETAGAMAQLQEIATHDTLTGILNRREFDRRLQEEWQRSTRFQRPLALAMADLDDFKAINDAHGHQTGDDVLRHVAGLVTERIRQVDCLARYGGDEFALIMVETNRREACATAARLHGVLESTPCLLPERKLAISIKACFGVAAWSEDANSLAGLVAAADAALYAAKRRGRNRVMAAGA
jgi:diguanylate cyclase (GGDEF)-like protein